MGYTKAGDGDAVPGDHWTAELFVRHEEIFRAVHEHAWPYGVEQAQQMVRIFQRFGIESGARVLDAPCGIGRRALALAARGFRVVAVDSNDVGIEAARMRVPPNLRPFVRFGRSRWK